MGDEVMQLTAEERARQQLSANSSRARAAWARLIRKVYEADPLERLSCNGRIRVIALIQDPGIVHRKRNASVPPGCGKALAALSELE
jgi:hypothetical protein